MFSLIKNYVSELGAWGAVVQLIGFGAALCEFLSYQQKTQKRIMLVQSSANGLWILHMFLLGAPAASIQNIIGFVRALVYSRRSESKWARSRWWYAVFIVASGIATVFTWRSEGWYAIFPFLAMLFSTISYSFTDAFRVRSMSLLVVPCWETYNIIHGSIAGIFTEIFNFISLILGIARIDLPRLKEKRKQKNISDSEPRQKQENGNDGSFYEGPPEA